MSQHLGYTIAVKLLDVVKLSRKDPQPRQYRFITDAGFYVSNFTEKTSVPDPREHPNITLTIIDHKVVSWAPTDRP